ncbi:ATP-binding protein [Streptomyces sp. NPDC007100]|uniref:ATP-binding protein n=1 Tax=Streptomyces sp. NPDC007100 TaxID=3155602 RepID=UPI0034081097
MVVDLLTLADAGELAADARALVSELVTNVYQHTRTTVVRLDVAVYPQSVRVAVWDDAPGSRLLNRDARADDVTGRGLLLVEAFASRWGVYQPNAPERQRKGVWFALDRKDSAL